MYKFFDQSVILSVSPDFMLAAVVSPLTSELANVVRDVDGIGCKSASVLTIQNCSHHWVKTGTYMDSSIWLSVSVQQVSTGVLLVFVSLTGCYTIYSYLDQSDH